jgi:hypothetical protein
MIPLRRNDSIKRHLIKKILIITIIVGFTGITIPSLTKHTIPLVSASNETVEWNITLRITETSGTGNIVVFGEKPDASDELDKYDLPEPPPPPQLPYIRSWLETSFKIPFNNLLQEYKSSSSNHTVWNLSLLWIAAPGNLSNTIINIHWDSPFILSNLTHSLFLYENDIIISNMITENSYSFSTNGSLHHFQIIYQRDTLNNSEKSVELPIFAIALGSVVCIVIITAAIFFRKRKKN